MSQSQAITGREVVNTANKIFALNLMLLNRGKLNSQCPLSPDLKSEHP